MQLFAYLLLYPLFWFLSVLPFRVLYFLSDVVSFIAYYCIGYRKKTIRNNLAIALPHLNQKERLKIEKKAYKHMIDIFFEMIKTMTISDKQIEKRFVIKNIELLTDLESEGKSIVAFCAHYASYEWLVSMHKYTIFEAVGIYKRIRNPYFDKLVRKIRSRFKASLVDTKEAVNLMIRNKRDKKLCMYGFAADQTPKKEKAHHWLDFMGINVPVHTGAEMLSKKLDLTSLYINVEKVKRGHYEATFLPMTKNAKAIPDYELTDEYIKLVEAQIYAKPEYYLWSHKRWKHAENLPNINL